MCIIAWFWGICTLQWLAPNPLLVFGFCSSFLLNTAMTLILHMVTDGIVSLTPYKEQSVINNFLYILVYFILLCVIYTGMAYISILLV